MFNSKNNWFSRPIGIILALNDIIVRYNIAKTRYLHILQKITKDLHILQKKHKI